MKKPLLTVLTILISSMMFGQQLITSTQDGNATNIFTWDCTCIPQPSDSVVVAHNVTMDADWYSTGGLTVLSGASFIEGAQRSSILIDNGGTFNNYGISQLTNMSFTNGASGHNTGAFTLDSGMFVGQPSSFVNDGDIYSLDSLMTLGSFSNGSNAFVGPGDIYVEGLFTNDGTVGADSLLNQGTYTNNGFIYCNEFGNTGTFNNNGLMDIAMNFYNTGFFTSSAGTEVEVGIDFWSADSINGTAILTNDGHFEIFGDWYNGDTLNGNGGYFCIGGNTSNWGNVYGTIDICDANGGGIDSQLGTVAGTVTYCSTPCNVGIQELTNSNLSVYPNPTNGLVSFESDLKIENIRLFDLSGREVSNRKGDIDQINIAHLRSGVYLMQVNFENGHWEQVRLIKD